MRTDYLDCCDQPALEVVRTLYQVSHDLEPAVPDGAWGRSHSDAWVG